MAGWRGSSFDRRPGRSRSFYDVKLVSPERWRKGGELVRSLGADEIKRDDLAIHASPDSTAASHSVRVHFFRPNGSNDIQFSDIEANF